MKWIDEILKDDIKKITFVRVRYENIDYTVDVTNQTHDEIAKQIWQRDFFDTTKSTVAIEAI